MTRDATRGPAPSGPLGMSALFLATVLAVSVAGCAASGPSDAPDAGPAPGPAEEERPAEAEEVPSRSELMDRLEPLVRAGEHDRVVRLADSLYFTSRAAGERSDAVEALWWESRSLVTTGETATAAERLGELLERYPGSDRAAEAARELARARVELGDDPGAVVALLGHPDAVNDSALAVLRSAAAEMSISELRSVAEAHGGSGRGGAVVRAELAFALARADRDDEARDVASRVVDGEAEDDERQRARRVLDGTVEPWQGAFRVGVLVPTSGRLEQVGAGILDGMELAEATLASSPDRPALELDVTDAAGEPDLGSAVARFEEQGVVALVGGVRSSEIEALAEGRSGPGFTVVSPTATRMPERWPDVYTLWDAERRALDGARALGRWLGTEAAIGQVAALYPANETGERSLVAFRSGMAAGGGWLTAVSSYSTDTTDFQGPIDLIGAFDPRAVFVVADDPGTVLQLVPQLSYYGMRSTVVAGDPTWSEPEALRRLDPSVTQLRLVASLLDRGVEGSGWERFRSAYEREYRRGLGNNVLPALGHDALLLLGRAASDLSLPRSRALARRFSALADVEGATGVLRPRRTLGAVERRATVRGIRERTLAAVEGSDVVEWLEGAEQISDVQRRRRRSAALQAVRDAVERAEAPEGEAESGDGSVPRGGDR